MRNIPQRKSRSAGRAIATVAAISAGLCLTGIGHADATSQKAAVSNAQLQAEIEVLKSQLSQVQSHQNSA